MQNLLHDIAVCTISLIKSFYSINYQALLRLEHLFEENETTDELSKQVTVTLTENFFSTFTITKVQEMTLGGNMLKSELNRLHWQTNGNLTHVSKM